ncbi:acylneuraminate cytidylyltransferase family protein [Ensifer sp. T173]|uniref:Acylneuraminate cytidylyltransferase family protein n=1 Tax=Ensifer canadensis TaxID=555315 RepID=A0AAW4FVP8_9HYPH|nr:acylneuraminate cytidylyltransferase family protein [Ensifer canadensis]MBM3095511.1 acylneuraminate cytidylyltransferase family protein [Ensifer canadensis]UBI79108.1 acylneuraminate cytidylyltransferase family protein [Ensifer canadensis]
MSQTQITALIPLRGGSKSIPDKNIKTLADRPLCAWVLKAACDCDAIGSVYVSTDSDKIRQVVEGLGLPVTVIDRPQQLAQDHSSTEDVMMHFASVVPFETLVTIQATSPLLEGRDLDKALKLFEAGSYDSMLSAVRLKRFFWNDDFTPVNYDPLHRPRRQVFDGILMENGAFYVTTRRMLETSKCRLGGKTAVYEMGEHTAVEIDEPEDWVLVERVLQKRGLR